MDNIQTLHYMKEQYKNLENNYFNLENSRVKKYEEFEEILRKKEEEKKHLESINQIYENHQIEDLDYFKLKSLESKLLKSLGNIKERKQIIINESLNRSPIDRRVCVICYEKEIKILLKPCSHLCVCSFCATKVDSCPVCREIIISKESVKFY